jgi:uncharacterized protein
MSDAKYWINKLDLQRHPEGGYYKETFRAQEIIPEAGLPPRFQGPHNISTAIYYLLEKTDQSHFHRIRADEIWHFYSGSSIVLHVFDPLKFYSRIRMGSQPEAGDVFQTVIPAGSWFAAHVLDPEGFALMGCTVAPGFEFKDFELGQREDLIRHFPDHRDIIEKLTQT